MSLEQKTTVLFFIFWLSFFIPNMLLKVIFLVGSCWYLRNKLSLGLIILLFICLVWVVSGYHKQQPEINPYCGTVVDFSENYVLLKDKQTQVAMFTEMNVNYHDKLCVTGNIKPVTLQSNFFTDPITNWQITSNHLGTIELTDIKKTNNSLSFKGKLYKKLNQSSDTEWMIILLFTRKISSNSLLLVLMLSSGLQYSYALRLFKKGLSKLIVQEHANVLLVVFWIVFRIIWGTSFVWWRVFFMVVCMQFMPNKKLGLTVGYGLLLVMFPTMYAHLSFVFPMLLHMIYYHQKPSQVQRFLMMAIIQHMLLYASNLMLIVGFSLFRHISGLAYAISWLLIVFSFLRKPFNKLMDIMMRIPAAPWMTLNGKLPFFIGFFMLMVLLGRSFTSKKYTITLCVSVLLCLSLWLYPPYDLVLFFNVGQADASLIRTRFSQDAFMIDVGRKSNTPLISKSLQALGVQELDAILLSHGDDDHAGGLESLTQQIHVHTIHTDKKVYAFHSLDYIGLNRDYQGSDDNDHSMVGLLKVGELVYLFLGDLYQQGELNMIQEYPNLKVDVLKVAHHGSKTSTSPKLLAQVQPRFGVISSDPTVYGHPHDSVLATLFDYKVLPLLTDEEGDIAFVRFFNVQFVITSGGRFGIIR